MEYFELKPPVQVGDATITLLGVGNYDNGRIAVQAFSLLSEEDGGDGEATEPWDTLSVNLVGQLLPNIPGAFFARSYSYHAKTFAAMVEAGIIEGLPGSGDVGGHGICSVARLTDKAKANPKTFE